MTVLANVDISISDAEPLGVALGEEYLHILYHEYREDVSGIERAGLMYTHGEFTESSWTFQSSDGDAVSQAKLEVIVVDGEDRLVGAWIEGEGKTTTLVSAVTDSAWSNNMPNRLLAPGASGVHLEVRPEGVYLFHDEINHYGPVIRWGLVADEDGTSVNGLSNMLASEILFGIGIMEEDTMICALSESGSYSLYRQASIGSRQDSIDSPSLLTVILEDPFLWKATLTIGLLLVGVFVAVRRSRSQAEEALELVDDGEGVEIMIQPESDEGPLLSIDTEGDDLVVSGSMVAVIDDDEVADPTLAQELEKKFEDGGGNARLQRSCLLYTSPSPRDS